MIQGSHIVVPRLYDHEYAYLFQAPDGRVVFAIPFEDDFTLVGTTEREHTGDLAHPEIAPDEVRYLLGMVERYFGRKLAPRDVAWTYAGIRPLLGASDEDPKGITRDYLLEFDRTGPPLVSIYGGKLTTYRRLAEEVVDRICATLGVVAHAWTARTPLPGGDMPGADFDAFRKRALRRYLWLDRALLQRYVRAYGTRMDRLLAGCTRMADLGATVLPGLTEREIDYLRREEFAVTADDILFRRSKLGVHLPTGAAARLDRWLEARVEFT
jgi:glycerol-3-phosphate dehydrogenase